MEKVNETLRKIGYNPKNFLQVQDACVLETIDPYGNTVFVELSENLNKNKNYKYLTTEQDVIPQEVLDRTKDNVHMLTGALIYHDNYLCILHKGEMSQYIADKNLSVPKTLLYPFVHISEIKKTPEAVTENTDLVSSRLHNSRFEEFVSNLHLLNEAYIAYQEEAEHFYLQSDNIMSDLIRSTEKARDDIDILAKNSPGEVDHAARQQTLHRREKFLIKLEQNINIDLAAQITSLRIMTDKMQKSRAFLQKEYEGIGI